ncbi:MAG: ABC transporter permease [SAR324 cluster bacterium]|nr:ABC transporter permease [SAR324 cluster bacterium]
MRFLQKKLMHLIPVMFLVTVITFLFVNLLPGDVAYIILGEEATPEAIAIIQEELRLNEPMLLRYLWWMGDVLSGDFGNSFITQEPVMEALLGRLPVTLELMLITQAIAVLLALPLGVLSAYRAGRPVDRIVSGAAFGMLSIPNFMMAIILIFIFAVTFGALPATGYEPISEGLWKNLRTFILPSLTLALIEWCALMRLLRSDMIATLQEEFITVARAKGLPYRRILFTHALKPSLFSAITLFGLNVASLISGSLVVETIFALPGIGRLLVDSVFSRDYIMVQGVVLFAAIGFVLVNFLVDALYAVLDPRIRHEHA